MQIRLRATAAIFSSLLFCAECVAQMAPATYPKTADFGVSGVTLNFRKSSEDILKDQLQLKPLDSRYSLVSCYNNDKTQILSLYHRLDRSKNSIQRFRVSTDAPLEKKILEVDSTCTLSEIWEFESSRGVKLGMSVSEVTAIFGSNFQVDTRGAVTILQYSIDSNLQSAFLQHYNELSYSSRYYFKAGRLIEFTFGFD